MTFRTIIHLRTFNWTGDAEDCTLGSSACRTHYAELWALRCSSMWECLLAMQKDPGTIHSICLWINNITKVGHIAFHLRTFIWRCQRLYMGFSRCQACRLYYWAASLFPTLWVPGFPQRPETTAFPWARSALTYNFFTNQNFVQNSNIMCQVRVFPFIPLLGMISYYGMTKCTSNLRVRDYFKDQQELNSSLALLFWPVSRRVPPGFVDATIQCLKGCFWRTWIRLGKKTLADFMSTWTHGEWLLFNRSPRRDIL